jgi:hypothetical protein
LALFVIVAIVDVALVLLVLFGEFHYNQHHNYESILGSAGSRLAIEDHVCHVVVAPNRQVR